jgi:hypothetical protein
MPIDYSKYPPNWKTEIVPAIRERSGNNCEQCGLTNGQIVYAAKFQIRDIDGRYKAKSLWFSSENDAKRESPNRPYKPVKVILTVAHLDHDETNHEVPLERLKHLCQICHLRYDSKEKYRRSLA